MLSENLERVKEKIRAAAKRVGRAPEEIKLVLITKLAPLEKILEAYELGVRDFGENKVQELLKKIDQLPKDIIWHFVGHLQTNKVKYIIDKIKLIHSLDSCRLAEELNKRGTQLNRKLSCLLQVNTSGETSKFGLEAGEVEAKLAEIGSLGNIEVIGLMTIGPLTENREDIKASFASLRRLRDDLRVQFPQLRHLSMGMSQDYEIAIEEGADILRIGSAVFGDFTRLRRKPRRPQWDTPRGVP